MKEEDAMGDDLRGDGMPGGGMPGDAADATLDPRIRARLDALPREVEPAQDLWPTIRARIEAGRVQALPGAAAATGARLDHVAVPGRGAGAPAGPIGGPRRWHLAAAAVLLVVASSASTWAVLRATRAPAPVEALATFEPVAREAAGLSARLDARRPRLDARTLAILERSLRTIDLAIAEAREALATDPANPAIHAFVAQAYRRKIDFLERANALEGLEGP
jgi:hypothetical protein